MSDYNYKKFSQGKKITDAYLSKKNIAAIDTITILFEQPPDFTPMTDKCYLEIIASAECCSVSWFEFFDDDIEEKLVGKTIKLIETLDSINMPPSQIQEVDHNNLVQITFTDGSKYKFVLRNSSNGYYSGWIDIVTHDNIIPPDSEF